MRGRTPVDLDVGELAIGWQLQRVGKQIPHRQTKTEGSDAILPLPDICAAALKLRADSKRAREGEAPGGRSWIHVGLVPA